MDAVKKHLLQKDPFQRTEISLQDPGNLVVAEAVALVDAPLREVFPDIPDHRDPHPGIKSRLAVADREGVHRDHHPDRKPRIKGDPDMIRRVLVVVMLDLGLELVTDQMDKRRVKIPKELKPPGMLLHADG